MTRRGGRMPAVTNPLLQHYVKLTEFLGQALGPDYEVALHDLTNKVAKPAVSYGGKYRIVDFPLSNCANSGIDVVGVLTQYESVLLNSYVAAGGRWGLDAKDSGVFVLPPREKADSNLDVYRGTADAISQNIDFIDSYSPEYLLVLSGDHIYKMNYAKMLAHHRACNADATIAVIEVPMKEASRFGIMNTDEEGTIVEFEEKPPQPKSNLASMGIYIFNWDILKKYLIEDEADPNSSNDFGNNIIPNLLKDGRNMYAYHFSGYWKDVETISSLWEANMEILDPEHSGINLFDNDWKIYSRNSGKTGHKITETAVVENCMITDGCRIAGHVKRSILFSGVKVAEGAEVEDAVIMGGTVIESGAVVKHCIVAENVVIGQNAVVGEMPHDGEKGVATIGSGIHIGERAKVGPNAMVNANVKDGEEEW